MPTVKPETLKILKVNELENLNQFTKFGYLESHGTVQFKGVEYDAPEEITLNNLTYGGFNTSIEIDPNVFYSK